MLLLLALGLCDFLFYTAVYFLLLFPPAFCLYKTTSTYNEVRSLCFSYSSCIFSYQPFSVKHKKLYFRFLPLFNVCNEVLE